MKRKHDSLGVAQANGSPKRRAVSEEDVKIRFRNGLFETKVLEQYTRDYATSSP